MALTLNYYLNNDNRYKQKEKAIYLYIHENYRKFTLNTGEKIDPKHWNAKEKKVKKSYIGSPELNNYLEKFKLNVLTIIRNFKADNLNYTFDELKNHVLRKVKNKSEYDFFAILEKYIEIKTTTVSKAFEKKIATVKTHLQNFQNENNYELTFESIDLIFFDSFHSYLIKHEISTNTIKKYFQILKSFMRYAVEREYTQNRKFENHKNPKSEEVKNIALTFDELEKLIHCKLNESLSKVRDVFLFQLYTGQRFSDISKFDIDNVKNNIWYLKQQKTGKIIEIPLISSAIEIINKYEGKLPIISNQKTNSFLKEIGKQAEINDIVTKEIKGKAVKMPKYELLTTHTARRSFVTLASYRGINQQVVKAVTGHGSDKMLNQYFKDNINSTQKAIEGIFTN